MQFAPAVRRRLKELGTEQRDLAAAAHVTESYISQLLTGKKAPPAPARTDIYDRMERFLRFSHGQLAKLAELERKAAATDAQTDPPAALLTDVRELILRKCAPAKQKGIRAIFERDPFGALEQLVAQKLLDVAKRVAREELEDQRWLRRVARLSGRSFAELRVVGLDFLETDVINLSAVDCATFLDPLIESWDIDLATFGMEIVLNRRLARDSSKKFAYVECHSTELEDAPGLRSFLRDPALSGDATSEEISFLRQLTFARKRPTALYYYRQLQSLRDPLHFEATASNSKRSL